MGKTVRIVTDASWSDFCRVMRGVGLDPDAVITGRAEIGEAVYPGRGEAAKLVPLVVRSRVDFSGMSDRVAEDNFARWIGNYIRANVIQAGAALESLSRFRRGVWFVRRTLWVWQAYGWLRRRVSWQRF